CEGEPDERTDAMPEIVAHREGADKSFEAVVPVLGPLDRTMRWPLKLADHSADTEAVHFADGHRAHVQSRQRGIRRPCPKEIGKAAEEIPVCPARIKPEAAH